MYTNSTTTTYGYCNCLTMYVFFVLTSQNKTTKRTIDVWYYFTPSTAYGLEMQLRTKMTQFYKQKIYIEEIKCNKYVFLFALSAVYLDMNSGHKHTKNIGANKHVVCMCVSVRCNTIIELFVLCFCSTAFIWE